MIGSRIDTVDKTLDIVIPVYNDAPYITESLNSIFKQKLINGWHFHIYVVDDGSDMPVKVDAPKDKAHMLSVTRLDENSGCSVARNKGAFAGEGEVILFLDADCSFAHENVLALLLEQYIAGFDVCFGQINIVGAGFWATYQNNVSRERCLRFRQGEESSMTTAIFIVKRRLFEKVGEFDEAYHFGFEDRDLFIALSKREARTCLVEEALVNHNDEISLTSVTKKLYKSGATSSVRFIEKHPDEYKKMEYVKADVRFSKGSLKLIALLTKPFLWPMVRLIDVALRKEWLSFSVAKKLVKCSSGLAYLQGTNVREK
ncbi:MAG: hypothetical protein A6F70_07305 [Cycloclasticus sp. symbiont of Bathymodiolus heckerae]|nr:MAG: hypothetical protein A6F70_07305 [Cycloclasticus sp. symbiont of Bathymodiolus heckerae]